MRAMTARRWVTSLWMTAFVLAAAALPAAGEDGEDPAKPAPAGEAVPAAVPAIVTLREAAARGDLDVSGLQPTSYKRVHLQMRNKTDAAMRVDICGSYLEPRRRGSCQRLGIGPVVTPRKKGKRRKRTRKPPKIDDSPPGTVVLHLAPGKVTTLEVNTCCLDAGKPAPSSHTFRVASKKLPPVREEALRWWADNPDAPQYIVNSAIWQSRPIDDMKFGGKWPGPRGGTDVAQHAGTVYFLRRGELLARDPDGINRFLGTEIQSVHPTDSAVYAVSWGQGMRSRDQNQVDATKPPRELWRLVHTGDEPWKRIVGLPKKLVIRDVRVSPGGDILIVTDKGISRVDRKSDRLRSIIQTEDTERLSIAFTRKGRARVAMRRAADKGYHQGGEPKGRVQAVCELWDVDPKSGAKERVQDLWNVRSIHTGPAGTYGLTGAGKLRRRVGRSMRHISGSNEFNRILHVGRKHIWLESGFGRLVAVDAAGRLRFSSGPRIDPSFLFRMDRHNDQLVYKTSRKFRRIEPRKGAVEDLDTRAAREPAQPIEVRPVR